ncbi:hypothetical protein Hanom_Chr01g00049691 [Helianthus anomalus]
MIRFTTSRWFQLSRRLPRAETSAYKRESPPTPMISLLILTPESKRKRPPLVLRLLVFFVCRFRSKSYLT